MAKTGSRFGKALTWQRKIEGRYYLFQYGYDSGLLQVFRSEYDIRRWEDVWVLKHSWETDNG